MKQTHAVIISVVALIICMSLNAIAELTSVPVITIIFEPAKTVFVKNESARRDAEIMKRMFLEDKLSLDAVTQQKGEKIWCKRAGTNSYTDICYDKHISVRDVESLKNPSAHELTRMLGDPVFAEGPLGLDGVTFCTWRIYNGEKGGGW